MPSEPPIELRRLAAILAVDMVGYSRHMQVDEPRTLRALREARTTIIDPAIVRHGGIVFKTTGDGLLCEFSSAVAATQCALDIQRGMPAAAADGLGQFRIGVSLGEIVVDGDDRYGDGVNLAARLEAVAPPGGVAVPRLVRDQVEGKLPARFVSRGTMALKNIAQPVEVFDALPADAPVTSSRSHRRRRLSGRMLATLASAVLIPIAVGAILFVWQRGGTYQAAQSTAPLIAVLPFANQSGDAADDYFSDGLTDDVIGALGRFSSLAVLSRNSVMPFKGRTGAGEEAVQKLGARYIIEGSARRSGDRVRIQARLTDARDARVLWSDRFVGSTSELFNVQDDLVQQIAGTLASQVDRVERERVRRKPTDNLDAYDLVLRGRGLLDRSTRASYVEARRLFERAIAADPQYADARVWLAHVLIFYVQYGFTETPLETAREAEALTREALRLDPANALAYATLGAVLTYFDRYDDALAMIDRALAINPSDADSHAARAGVLMWSGRLEEARSALELARRLDPGAAARPDWLFTDALLSLLMRQPDRARAALEGHLVQNPRFAPLYALLAIAYAELGRPEDAAGMADAARRLDPVSDRSRFGSRLRDAAQRKVIADGLRKAGLLPN